jgi:hypothetical protein
MKMSDDEKLAFIGLLMLLPVMALGMLFALTRRQPT